MPSARVYPGKRLIDVILAVAWLIALSPILFTVAILIRTWLGAPVFFRQVRLGLDGQVFTIYKFRTMSNACDSHGNLLPDTERFTGLGKLLRRLKIDELPQLLNVLDGTMSLVGPRPALPDQLEEYDVISRRRLAVRPGITGLAQVNGNTQLPWPERWKYDALYTEHISFALDLWIIWRTFIVVLLGEEKFKSLPDSSKKEFLK